jgi:GNAT superfamily N-acetyltransferase
MIKLFFAANLIFGSDMNYVEQGRLDFFRSSGSHHFQETAQNALYVSGMDYAPCNGVMEKDPNRQIPQAEIEQTIDFFTEKKLPFIWWTASKTLEANAFQFGGILTGISLDISSHLPPKPDTNAVIKIVETQEELALFNQLAAECFGMAPNAAEQWLAVNNSVMKRGEQIHFLALIDNHPVGTATLSTLPTSAGIWNLATLAEHRKAGIGAALVHAALVEAKNRHYTQVMAILMPKGMAWGLFTKLGFTKVCEFPFYIHGVSGDLEKS